MVIARHLGLCRRRSPERRARNSEGGLWSRPARQTPQGRRTALSPASIVAAPRPWPHGPIGLSVPTSESLSERQRDRLLASAGDALPAVRRRGPRLRLLPRRRRGRGRGGARRPRLRDRAVPRARPSGTACGSSRVLETHTHADHVSGHGRLALEHGHPGARSTPPRSRSIPHDPLADGDELRVGSVTRALPAHARPPARALLLLVAERAAAADGRLAVRRRRRAARPRGRGARGRRGALPQPAPAARAAATTSQVFPGHVAGSLCGAGDELDPSSTIGAERRGNALLALATRRRVRRRGDGRRRRRGRRTWSGSSSSTAARSSPRRRPPEPADARATRPCSTCGPPTPSPRGHVPGALNVPVSGGSFGDEGRASCCRRDEPVVAARGVAGRGRAGGRAACARSASSSSRATLGEPQATETIEPVVDRRARRGCVADGEVEVIDVRELDERDDGYIPGSRHIPYRLAAGLRGDLGRRRSRS